MRISEKEWFILYTIALHNQTKADSEITSSDLVGLHDISQQTVSRRLIALEEQGYIQKRRRALSVTPQGMEQLREVWENLALMFDTTLQDQVFAGVLSRGMGEGGYYIGLTGYVEQFAALLQAQPFHGTFNLQLAEDVYDRFKMAKKTFLPKLVKGFTSENRTFGDVVCYFGFIWPQGRKSQMRRCLLLDIERTSHKPGIIEIVAIENFRTQWECQDGDAFEIIFDTTQKSLPQ